MGVRSEIIGRFWDAEKRYHLNSRYSRVLALCFIPRSTPWNYLALTIQPTVQMITMLDLVLRRAVVLGMIHLDSATFYQLHTQVDTAAHLAKL